MGLTRAVALPFLHGVCHVTFVAVELRQDRVMMLCSSPPREARCAGTGGELLCDSKLTKLSLRSHPFSADGHVSASTQPAQPVRKLPCRSLTKLIARALVGLLQQRQLQPARPPRPELPAARPYAGSAPRHRRGPVAQRPPPPLVALRTSFLASAPFRLPVLSMPGAPWLKAPPAQ